MSSAPDVAALIAGALAEDVGPGDWTTEWTVPEHRRVEGRITARASGVIAGAAVAAGVFEALSGDVEVVAKVADGDTVEPGTAVMQVRGPARPILTGERVALNFLQRLSGVASLTRRYVEGVAGTGARILDTRKTTPGLRALEKAAVAAGGGENHRFGLHDMVLIKENHIAAAGGITQALAAVRGHNAGDLPVEIETRDLAEVEEALRAGVDRILFDNMSIPMLREAVRLVREDAGASHMETEASGGIDLGSVRGVAETGVDFISVGALTHSAPALDLSLLVAPS